MKEFGRGRLGRRAALAFVAACVAGLLVAIAISAFPRHGSATRVSATLTPAPALRTAAPTPQATPQHPSPAPTPQHTSPAPTASQTSAEPAANPATNQVVATVSGIQPGDVLVAGGSPLQFTVTITNGRSEPLTGNYPLVSLGACGCTIPGIMPGGNQLQPGTRYMTPAGTLDYRDASSSEWTSAQYVSEGTGMDYVLVKQHPVVSIPAYGSVSISYRLQLRPASELTPFSPGTTALDVTLISVAPPAPGDVPSHVSLASVPLQLSRGSAGS